jgi:hypothetical protein
MAENLRGTGNDRAYSIIQTDVGYLIAGTTESTNGDVKSSLGGGDGWVFQMG